MLLVTGGIVLSGDIQKPFRAARGAVSVHARSRAVAVVGEVIVGVVVGRVVAGSPRQCLEFRPYASIWGS